MDNPALVCALFETIHNAVYMQGWANKNYTVMHSLPCGRIVIKDLMYKAKAKDIKLFQGQLQGQAKSAL